MAYAPPARHLLRARDLADARYFEPLGVDDGLMVVGNLLALSNRLWRTEPDRAEPDTFHNLIDREKAHAVLKVLSALGRRIDLEASVVAEQF